MFDQYVDVVSSLGLQARIAQGDGIAWVVVGDESKSDGLSDVRWVGASQTTAVSHAEVRVVIEGEAERGAGEHFEIGTARARQTDKTVVRIKGGIGCVEIGVLKSNARHKANPIGEIDRVHDIGGGDPFDKIVVGRVIPWTNLASAQSKLTGVGVVKRENLQVVRSRSEGVSSAVVIAIFEVVQEHCQGRRLRAREGIVGSEGVVELVGVPQSAANLDGGETGA